MREEALFHEALSKSPEERSAFLDATCAGDLQLRAAVEALLAAHAAAASLLDQPAVDPHLTGAYTPPPQGATGVHVAYDAQPGYVIAGRYTLEQKLGEGGMGEVWVAKQTEPVKRKVALKLIKAGMDSKAVIQRFEAERQALALMDHPHIAKVLDGGLTADRHPFFVMELVNGLPLSKFCDEAKLTPRQRLELFVPICHAVQHAHQKGIVHRDLKPGNILVTVIDGRPVPKVIDFGVAKATAGKLTDESLSTGFGTVVGTLEYMAPEQAGYAGEDIDTRADIYSLGVILYEMLTGLRPLDSKRLQKAALTEMIRIIREEEPSKPSTRLSTDEALPSLAAVRQIEPKKLMALLRGELDWVVMKCLEKQRDRRYETANGLARDIQRYLADEPVEARPPSFGYRAGKFLRRHQGAVIAASLVLLALLAGMVGTTVGLMQANRAAEAERVAKDDALEQKRLAEQAAAAEKRAKEQAQKDRDAKEVQRKYAQAIADFFQKDLLALTSIEGQDRFGGEGKERLTKDTTLRQLLDRAADKLRQRQGRDLDPRTEADMCWMVGVSYRGVGAYEQSILFLNRCRELRLQEWGPDHEETWSAENSLALAYSEAGKVPQALALFERLRSGYERVLGPDHPDTLAMLTNLAAVYREAGQLDKAVALYEQLRADYVRVEGADHPDTLTIMNDLALAYREVGELAKALALLEQTHTAQVRLLGPDHQATLATLGNLAGAYDEAGQMDKAIILYERARDAQVKKLGPDHPDTLTTMNNLGSAYHEAGKLPQALALLEQVYPALVKQLGADHPNTLSAMENLAGTYRDTGKLPQALALYEQVRAARVKTLGADHPDTLNSLNNLAGAYEEADQMPKALALYEQVRDARVKKLGPDHPDTLTSLNNLALTYMAVGKLPLALPLLEQAATGVAKRRFLHKFAERIIPNTIHAYEEAQQWDQAERWQRQWLPVVKAKAGADSPEYATELVGLGENLLRQQKWTAAEAPLRECLIIEEKKAPNAWLTFDIQSMLGEALLGQKNYTAAEPLLLQGYQGLKQREAKLPKEAKVCLTKALERLVQLYTATNKPEEVQKWQAERAKYPAVVPPPGTKK